MKKIHILCLTIAFCLSGCSSKKDSNLMTNIEVESQNTEINHTQEDNDMKFNVDYINQVASIQVTDSIEGEYVEVLCIDIAQEDVEKLKSIQIAEGTGDIPGDAGFKYKLNMYDKDGDLVATWKVVRSKRILDHKGQLIAKDGELKEWAQGIENTYNISSKVYGRTPGENYFTELKNAYKGGGDESVDYYEGLEYIKFELDEEDIKGLQMLADTICVDEEPKEKIKYRDDLYYLVTVYTANDGVYYFSVMLDGTVYVQPKQTYQVLGQGVEDYFRKLESKYGLNKVNK